MTVIDAEQRLQAMVGTTDAVAIRMTSAVVTLSDERTHLLVIPRFARNDG
jgi:hypothetical protein